MSAPTTRVAELPPRWMREHLHEVLAKVEATSIV